MDNSEQDRSEQAEFERGCVGWIAREHIGEAQGDVVHRSGMADAEGGVAAPSAILDRAQQAGFEHADAHAGA